MTWLMGIIGFLLGAATGYSFGWMSGLNVACRIALAVLCDKCKAEFVRIHDQVD